MCVWAYQKGVSCYYLQYALFMFLVWYIEAGCLYNECDDGDVCCLVARDVCGYAGECVFIRLYMYF